MQKKKIRRLYINSLGESVRGVSSFLRNVGWDAEALGGWREHCGWQRKNSKDIAEEEAGNGSILHDYAHWSIVGDREKPTTIEALEPRRREKVKLCIKAFERFQEEFGVTRDRVILSEEPLVSDTYNFGGTPDMVIEDEREVVLIDWKTSSGIRDKVALQMAAYCHLLKEVKNISVSEVWVVRLDKKNGEYELKVWTPEQLCPAWTAFKAALQLDKCHAYCKKLVSNS